MAVDRIGAMRGTPQTSRVADELLRRIQAGEYPVGSKLPGERPLALEFEVSRPVVREALRMLTMLQVIDVQVGRGAFVTEASEPELALDDTGDLLDVIDVREVIEVGALKLAQSRASEEGRRAVAEALQALRDAVAAKAETTELDQNLHRAIIESSGSALLEGIWRSLEERIRSSIRLSPTGRSMSPEVLEDHEALASGVLDGHLEEALAAAERLAIDNRIFLRDVLGQS
jgi:GntR family transcriptional repressor for pyruvate dehydrogenase complex